MICSVHSESFFHLNSVLKYVEQYEYHTITGRQILYKTREATNVSRMIFVRRNSHGARERPPISPMLNETSVVRNPQYVWRKSFDYAMSRDLVF